MWSVAESETERTEWPESPPPPWPADVRATMWWHRAKPAGKTLVSGATIPLSVVIVVDYSSSPVGPYREILASPVLRRPGGGLGLMPRMAVPFIAVDSDASVHGGRTHWKLPKVLAEFDGDVLGDSVATAPGWSVRTVASPFGPTFPIRGSLGFAQPAGEGLEAAETKLTGKARLCRVNVEALGPTIGRWVASGTHLGLQVVSGKMVTGPARHVEVSGE